MMLLFFFNENSGLKEANWDASFSVIGCAPGTTCEAIVEVSIDEDLTQRRHALAH